MTKLSELEKLKRLQKRTEDKIQLLEAGLTKDSDYIRMTMSFLVEGKIMGKKVFFERGSETPYDGFMLFVKNCMMAECMIGRSSTYLPYMLDRYAKEYNISKEKEEEIMQEYWYAAPAKIDAMIKAYADGKCKSKTERGLVEWVIHSTISEYSTSTYENRLSLLYYIWKYLENEDLAEMAKDIENTPQPIKDFVDSLMVDSNEN